MGRAHPSTPEQRAQLAATVLAQSGEYGLVTRLSREHHVSRPTLYAWRDQAKAALLDHFSPAPAPALPTASARHILALWINHVSVRGIQAALTELLQLGLSLATITLVLRQAQQRAIDWMHSHAPPSPRALALDEIYGHNRRGAYLNVVDVHSGAVWASEGPLPVDTDSWTLLLWSLQDRHVRWERVVLDEGAPMHAACKRATPEVLVQLDQWHLWHLCGKVQAKLTRTLEELQARSAVVARQAERIARGGRPLARNPTTEPSAHAAQVASAERVVKAVAYLTGELHRLLDAVVVEGPRVLSLEQRQEQLEALLSLLEEVAQTSPAKQRGQVQQLAKRIRVQLPKQMAFAGRVEQLQQNLSGELKQEQQALLGWAWQRRAELDWRLEEIVGAVPEEWRAGATRLLEGWEEAVRVSSAVERWHSILRPHLSVRRKLSTGMLALLAVWHNHRVFQRGVHKGQNPLQLSGLTDAPTDWLLALGYPPDANELTPQTSAPALAA